MPLFDYSCKCGYSGEHIAKADEQLLRCPECGDNMVRQFHSRFGICMGAVGAYGYYDDNLQTYIRTNEHRKQVMREQGVTERIGKGWR